VTISSMIKRLVVSLCLALLAAAIPPWRAAVLDWMGASEMIALHIAADAAGGAPRAVQQTGP
jgi:hypothetical protein